MKSRLVALIVVGLFCALLSACGSGPEVRPPTEPTEPPVGTVEVTPAPIRSVVLYDPCIEGSCESLMGLISQVSDTVMLRAREDEYISAIQAAVKYGFKKGLVAIDSDDDCEKVPGIINAARGAGLQVTYVITSDEHDLSNLPASWCDARYNRVSAALTRAGIRSGILLGQTWSLYGDWKGLINASGIPKMDFLSTDSLYTPRADEIHLAVGRLELFVDFLRSKGWTDKPILITLKGFSRVPPDLQNLTAAWLHDQICAVTGFEPFEYTWEARNFVVKDLYLRDDVRALVQAIGFYKADPRRAWDSDRTLLTIPGGVEAVKALMQPRGLTAR